MRDKKIVPVFNSEAEEAQWWFDNRDRFESDLRQALLDGSARSGTVARRRQQAEQIVELDAADLVLAREIAAKRGVEYKAFVRELFHRQLEHERSLLQTGDPEQTDRSAA